MTLIFSNIYIYLFFALFTIYLCLIKVLKKPLLSRTGYVQTDFIMYLDKYLKNTNVAFSYFILLFYVFVTIVPFLLLRISRLGLTNEIASIEGIQNIIIFCIPFLLAFIYYLKIINIIVYAYILRLHFYLKCHYEFYQYLADDSFLKEPALLHDLTITIMSFFMELNATNKAFMESYKMWKPLIKNSSMARLKRKWLIYLYLRYYVKKSTILQIICKGFILLFQGLVFNISRFVYYIPYTIVIVSLGFDLSVGYIYYTYYALLNLYITSMLKKIRKFYYDKDAYKELLCILDKDDMIEQSHLLSQFNDRNSQMCRILNI